MASSYYAPCPQLDRCNELIETYFETQQDEECFAGHLALAEEGYPLAECQVGYFYLEGLGVEKDAECALFWTRRRARRLGRTVQPRLFLRRGSHCAARLRAGVLLVPQSGAAGARACAARGRLFDQLPDALTYPLAAPVFCRAALPLFGEEA